MGAMSAGSLPANVSDRLGVQDSSAVVRDGGVEACGGGEAGCDGRDGRGGDAAAKTLPLRPERTLSCAPTACWKWEDWEE